MKLLFTLLFAVLLVQAFDDDAYEASMDLGKKERTPCQSAADCKSTQTCKTIKLPSGQSKGICVRKCPAAGAPRKRCTRRCPCGVGEGPCKRRKHCKTGLRCKDGKCVVKTKKPAGTTAAPSAQGPGTTAAPVPVDDDFEVIGEDNGDEQNPYDLVAQCRSTSDCASPLVCRRVRLHKVKKEVRICAPKLPGALDDDSHAWDFFEDDATDDDVETEQDLKKKKKKKCDTASDCTKPLVCVKRKGRKKGRCKMPCPSTSGARKSPCTRRCKCGAGQGTCKSSRQCLPMHSCDAQQKVCVKKVAVKGTAAPAGTTAPPAGSTAPAGTTSAPFDEDDDTTALNKLSSSDDNSMEDDDSMDAVPDDDLDIDDSVF